MAPVVAPLPVDGSPQGLTLFGSTFYLWWGPDAKGNDSVATANGRARTWSTADAALASAASSTSTGTGGQPERDASVMDLTPAHDWLRKASQSGCKGEPEPLEHRRRHRLQHRPQMGRPGQVPRCVLREACGRQRPLVVRPRFVRSALVCPRAEHPPRRVGPRDPRSAHARELGHDGRKWRERSAGEVVLERLADQARRRGAPLVGFSHESIA